MAENLDEEQPKNRAEEVERWNGKISNARKWRDEICSRNRWKEMIEEYKGHWGELSDSAGIDLLPVNLIFAYIKTELPSLYIKDPHIKINPKNKTSINTAKVFETVINYIWYCKKIKREIKKAIIDALLIGHAWFKTGYTGTFGSVEDGLGGVVETVESEDFFAYRVPWDAITFDPDALDPPYDCEWIAHSIWLPLDEVKKNPKYKNTENLQASYTKADGRTSEDAVNKYSGKCRLTEVWHIKSKTVFTLADGAKDYIEDPKPWPLEGRGYPFSCLRFNFSNDTPYGISDVGIFEPQVLELIKVRSAALDHLKRYNRQLVTTPENLSDPEMEKLNQNQTGTVVLAQDPTKIMPIPYPPIASDVYALEERIKEDMINENGQSPAERGATQKTSTRTKAELIFQRQGAENRRSEKIDLVEDFVENIAGNLVELLKQFATEPYYVRVLGPNSKELQAAVQERASANGPEAVTNKAGFTFTAEDIKGEYDVEVVAGSSTPVDRGELTKTLLQLLEIAPKAGAIPGGPLIGTLARVLVETIDIPEITLGLEQEEQAQAERSKQQAQDAQEAKELSIASQGADSQIEATNAATKQNKVLVEFLKAFADMQSKDKETEGDLAREDQKMKHQMSLDESKLMHDMGLKEAKAKHDMSIKERMAKNKPKPGDK